MLVEACRSLIWPRLWVSLETSLHPSTAENVLFILFVLICSHEARTSVVNRENASKTELETLFS